MARPAGYHSGHVSACSSNEKCLGVNEINTDIRLAQQELGGATRARGKRECWLAGETGEARERERERKEMSEGGGHGEKDDVMKRLEEYEIFTGKGLVSSLRV